MNTTTADALRRSKGLDVSQGNGIVDWVQVRHSDYEFAFVRATEGGDVVDASFTTNRRGARTAGFDVGYSHLFRPSVPVDDQVNNFLKAVVDLEMDALCPVLVLEEGEAWNKFTVPERVQMIVEFCSKVKRALGSTPMLSGSYTLFTQTLLSHGDLALYDLWISNFNEGDPTVPKPWLTWSFWRFQRKGTVSGITGEVELSCFNGSNIARARHKRDEVVDETPLPPLVEQLWNVAIGLYFIGLLAVVLEWVCR